MRKLLFVLPVAVSVPLNSHAMLYSGSKEEWVSMWFGISFVIFVLPSILNFLACLWLANKYNTLLGASILIASILGTLAFNLYPQLPSDGMLIEVFDWELLKKFCITVSIVGASHLLLNVLYLIFRLVFRLFKSN